MKMNIKNIKLNYIDYGTDEKGTILLLHGWGQNIEMMNPIGDKYKEFFNVLIIDLPGFGKSEEPPYAWSVYEYVEFIHSLISELNLKKIFLAGHSFGGRLGLIYASIYQVEKLVCFASPYCKELKKLPLKTKIYKSLKKIFFLKWIANIMKKYIGSTDYKNASEVMRGVLVKSINIEMIEDVKKIKAPTLLVWGSLDKETPFYFTKIFKKHIKDCEIVNFKNCSHFAYLERPNLFLKILLSYFC